MYLNDPYKRFSLRNGIRLLARLAIAVAVLSPGPLLGDPASTTKADDTEKFLAHIDNREFDKASAVLQRIGDPDIRVGDNRTLLMEAAERDLGESNLLEEIAAAGADLDFRFGSGVTALDLAILAGRLQNARILIELGASSTRAKDIAEREGYFEIVELLEASGSAAQEELDERLRHAIRHREEVEVIRGLLSSGADIETETSYGARPLDSAMSVGRYDLANLLLDSGADPDGGTAGYSPLALAARNGKLDLGKRLIEAGADLNKMGNAKLTPLMAAARYGHTEIVELILAHGGDPNAANEDGHTALMIAENQYRRDISRLLRAAGAKPRPNILPSPLFTTNDPERVAELIGHGADVNGRNQWNSSVLGSAVRTGEVESVRLLVENGAKVNIDGEPRHFHVPPILLLATSTVQHDKLAEILRILLDHDADPDVQHFQRGQTPLHYLAERRNWDAVEVLLDAGASPDIEDHSGKTVREILRENQRPLDRE